MRNKIKIVLGVLVIFIFLNCNTNSKNIVKLANIEKRLKVGMQKKDVIKELGFPKDSSKSIWVKINATHYYKYVTDDFSGYFLRVWFNEDNEVVYYRVD